MPNEPRLHLLRAEDAPQGRSPTRRRFPGRLILHLSLALLAALGALLAARLAAAPDPSYVATIPPAPLSGVRAIAATGEASLRPGVSHTTTASPLRTPSGAPADRLRPIEGVGDASTLSEGVGRVAAAQRDAGETRSLSEQIAPSVPYVLYTARAGDTLSQIAENYGTTVDNILLNNAEVGSADDLDIGEQLIVPFATGILYTVVRGETLAAIVDDYLNVTVEDVVAYRHNNLSSAADIQAGARYLLPNAEPKPPPVYSEGGVTLRYYGIPEVSNDRFGLPLPAWGFISDEFGTYRGPGRIHTGIDFALAEFTASSVFAACDGWVSRTEWLTYSYGYYVVVDCGGGWETLYSHFREIIVSWGDRVFKGQTVLGISGSTGFSTGEHLHFEIIYEGRPLDPRDYLEIPYRREP